MLLERTLHEIVLSLRVRSVTGNLILDVVRNEVTFYHRGMWDFNFRFDFFEIISRKYKVLVCVDMRKTPAEIIFESFIAGVKVHISKENVAVVKEDQRTPWATIRGMRIINVGGFCFMFSDDDFEQSNAGEVKSFMRFCMTNK